MAQANIGEAVQGDGEELYADSDRVRWEYFWEAIAGQFYEFVVF